MLALVATNLALISAAMTVLWGVATLRRDVSIVDIFWGAGFVVVAWASFFAAAQPGWPQVLVACLVSVWGLRLTFYLAWRNWGRGEDYRYRSLRERIGGRFWWLSLPMVFGLQGLLMVIVSLPVQFLMVDGGGVDGDGLMTMTTMMMTMATANASADAWASPWLWLALLAWIVGFAFETIGDAQLARFQANPDNRGAVMDRGLWRYTRHPNYFGDFVVWWAHFALCAALASPAAQSGPLLWLTAIGPMVMSVLLLRVSGVTLVESTIAERRPGYRDYVARTSAFFPRPPRRR